MRFYLRPLIKVFTLGFGDPFKVPLREYKGRIRSTLRETFTGRLGDTSLNPLSIHRLWGSGPECFD